MKKYFIFYTARARSSRLPNKMLHRIAGKTVVELGLERALACGLPVVVCTTFLSEDDKIAAIAQNMGANVYRGSAEDILERYLGAARQYGAEFFIAVDGDDLFLEPRYIKEAVKDYKKNKPDAIFCAGLPLGSYGFSAKTSALEKVCQMKNEHETQGWARYFTNIKLFKVDIIKAHQEHNFAEYRLTLDYAEDLRLIKNLYKNLYSPRKNFSLSQVISFLGKHPKLAQSNWRRRDEYKKRFKNLYGRVYLKPEFKKYEIR